MIDMIENPQLTKEMGIRSREICEEKYNVYKVNDIILDSLLSK